MDKTILAASAQPWNRQLHKLSEKVSMSLSYCTMTETHFKFYWKHSSKNVYLFIDLFIYYSTSKLQNNTEQNLIIKLIYHYCIFIDKNKKISIILQIDKAKTRACKWIIVAQILDINSSKEL